MNSYSTERETESFSRLTSIHGKPFFSLSFEVLMGLSATITKICNWDSPVGVCVTGTRTFQGTHRLSKKHSRGTVRTFEQLDQWLKTQIPAWL